MSLIAMCVFDTLENDRSKYTSRTISSLIDTVDFNKHRLIIFDNASCDKTKKLLTRFRDLFKLSGWEKSYTIITSDVNVGTAVGINRCWKHRTPGEFLCKHDNDLVIRQPDWLETLQETIIRSEQSDRPIGICALKRKDLDEKPQHTGWAHSELVMLPQEKGEKWLIAEYVNHCMGNVCMFSPKLLDKIGGLIQNGIYGFDDSLAAVRAKVAGFHSAFVPYIEIDHIDDGSNPYQQEKEKYAGERMAWYHRMKQEYESGKRDVWVEI